MMNVRLMSLYIKVLCVRIVYRSVISNLHYDDILINILNSEIDFLFRQLEVKL